MLLLMVIIALSLGWWIDYGWYSPKISSLRRGDDSYERLMIGSYERFESLDRDTLKQKTEIESLTKASAERH